MPRRIVPSRRRLGSGRGCSAGEAPVNVGNTRCRGRTGSAVSAVARELAKALGALIQAGARVLQQAACRSIWVWYPVVVKVVGRPLSVAI